MIFFNAIVADNKILCKKSSLENNNINYMAIFKI